MPKQFNRHFSYANVMATVAVRFVFPAVSVAAGSGRGGGAAFVVVPAFLGIHIPSISDILRSIANTLFSVLAGAFLPGWLRHAPVETLRWLIALPDPADAVRHLLVADSGRCCAGKLQLAYVCPGARTANDIEFHRNLLGCDG